MHPARQEFMEGSARGSVTTAPRRSWRLGVVTNTTTGAAVDTLAAKPPPPPTPPPPPHPTAAAAPAASSRYIDNKACFYVFRRVISTSRMFRDGGCAC